VFGNSVERFVGFDGQKCKSAVLALGSATQVLALDKVLIQAVLATNAVLVSNELEVSKSELKTTLSCKCILDIAEVTS